MVKQYYYAVNRGHKTGVYLSWADCKEQVDGYKFPIYKKFETMIEAEDFAKNGKNSNLEKDIKSKSELDQDSENIIKDEKINKNIIKNDYVYLFCDGSAIHQNYKSVRCGYGICIIIPSKNNEIKTYSKLVNNHGTNNLAELMAIMDSLKLIETNEINKACIVSDSKYSIDCIMVWSINWKKNNWLTSKKTEPENSGLIKEILEKYESLLQKKYIIEFKHINSHKTKPSNVLSPEYFLWFGNEMADQLAREGVIIKEHDKPLFIIN